MKDRMSFPGSIEPAGKGSDDFDSIMLTDAMAKESVNMEIEAGKAADVQKTMQENHVGGSRAST